MPSSGMLRHVDLVRTTLRNIPEDGILPKEPQSVQVVPQSRIEPWTSQIQVLISFNCGRSMLKVPTEHPLNVVLSHHYKRSVSYF
jgi:hypothetical protein